MKKYLFIPLFVLIAVVTYAQEAAIGFNIGATASTYKMKNGDESSTSKSKIGFTTGFITDIPIGRTVSFQPAIQFTQKGGILKESAGGNSNRQTTKLDYFEFPLNILYKTKSSGGRFYMGGGPSLALGLSGRVKIESETTSYPIIFGKSNGGEFKRLEFGINLLTGYHFSNGIFISLNYNSGLNNLVIDASSNNSFKNRYFGLRLGYMRGKKKFL